MARIVAIVGKSSVGKSTLRKALAERLQWTSVAIDEHRQLGGGWGSLIMKLSMATYPMLVESIAFPPTYREILAEHDAKLIVVRCQEAERIRRGGEDIDRAYDYEWTTMKTVDTTNGLPDIEPLVKWCRMPA